MVNCTTPANYFHALRRQMHRDFRKPLIVFTPKSLLRHKKCASTLADLGEGSSFHRVLWDDAQTQNGNTAIRLKPDNEICRVVMSAGKVYYDLLDEREKRGRNDVYLLRLEQFYPWPMRSVMAELARFPNAELVWCQEEPMNMGAWTYAQPNIDRVLDYLKAANAKARYAQTNSTQELSQMAKEVRNFINNAKNYLEKAFDKARKMVPEMSDAEKGGKGKSSKEGNV